MFQRWTRPEHTFLRVNFLVGDSVIIRNATARGFAQFPAPPRRVLVTGGGRHNPVLMQMLAARLGRPVAPVEAVGWEGDAIEAQAFAYLALRVRAGLPLSFPGTTGVPQPMTGGVLHRVTR